MIIRLRRRRTLMWWGIGVFAGLCVLAGAFLATLPKLPAHKTTARVVGIAQVPEQYSARVEVMFQSPSGRTASVRMDPADNGCRIGGVVNAEERGATLSIERGACLNGTSG